MPVILITYDLNSPGQKYEEIIEAIKSNSRSWCSYWKSSYLIKTNLSPDQFVNKISHLLDNNDKLIAIEVTNNKQGWLNNKNWNFINDNIFS